MAGRVQVGQQELEAPLRQASCLLKAGYLPARSALAKALLEPVHKALCRLLRRRLGLPLRQRLPIVCAAGLVRPSTQFDTRWPACVQAGQLAHPAQARARLGDT